MTPSEALQACLLALRDREKLSINAFTLSFVPGSQQKAALCDLLITTDTLFSFSIAFVAFLLMSGFRMCLLLQLKGSRPIQVANLNRCNSSAQTRPRLRRREKFLEEFFSYMVGIHQ